MQKDSKRIPRQLSGRLCENATDLASMVTAMHDEMCKNFLSRHSALVAIGEGKRDRLATLLWCDTPDIVEIPLIRCRDSAA